MPAASAKRVSEKPPPSKGVARSAQVHQPKQINPSWQTLALRPLASSTNLTLQRAPDCQGDKPVDPDVLGPAFVKPKSDVEKLGLTKHTVKPSISGVPYVLFSPHCEAGKVPLKGLIEHGEAYLISSGKIYRQVWAQQQGKAADQLYWGWINPKLIEPVATPPPAPTQPTKPDPPQSCPGAGADSPTCESPPPTAKPDVQCPKDLDDSAALRCFSQAVREEVRHSAEGDIYQARLKQAVELMQKAGFGRLEGTPVQFDPTSPVEWEGETYNKSFWTAEDHPKFQRKLVLKEGKQPADAIDDMFANLGKWNVDCGQFVQVAHLYAMRHALGAKGFNQMKREDVAFELKPQGSTAVKRSKFYERSSPTAQMLRYPEKELETKSIDDLLKEAPNGSRVMWTNLQHSLSSAFRNENTLKLGDDQFAAHGFFGSLKKNVFTRKELELELAKTLNKSADEEYIKNNVFISEIEHYSMPQNPKP
jgi:protein-glutamine gamma-glutamyltransferase-like protein